MRFRQFILLEQDPMGGGDPMAGGMGGDPMGGAMGGAPPMGGGDPMGGGMGDPMGGGMGGGAPAAPAEAPTIPKTLDVWAVLDHILNNKPLPSKEAPEPPPGNDMGMGAPPPPPGGDMGMGAPPDPMGGMGAPPAGGMAAPPPGGPGPALMG